MKRVSIWEETKTALVCEKIEAAFSLGGINKRRLFSEEMKKKNVSWGEI